MVSEHAFDGSVSTTVLGYTTEVDEYMAAADLLIGKAGGLTTSEGIAKACRLLL